MTTTASKKISKTGYAMRMKPWGGRAETWTVTTARGLPIHHSAQLNAQECRGLVCAGALRRVEVIRLTGGIVYQLVEVTR